MNTLVYSILTDMGLGWPIILISNYKVLKLAFCKRVWFFRKPCKVEWIGPEKVSTVLHNDKNLDTNILPTELFVHGFSFPFLHKKCQLWTYYLVKVTTLIRIRRKNKLDNIFYFLNSYIQATNKIASDKQDIKYLVYSIISQTRNCRW